MIRKNLIKSLSVVMAAMLAIMTVACGANTTEDASVAVEETAQEKEHAYAHAPIFTHNIAVTVSKDHEDAKDSLQPCSLFLR